MEWTGIRAITFDCQGALVDWQAGIATYVAPHLERAARIGIRVTPTEWLARWEIIQFGLLRRWRPYSEILAESFALTMRAFGLESFADGGPGLARSVPEWPAYGDGTKALRQLARRRRLALISNMDNVTMAETLGRLMLPLSVVVTSEDARAHKPEAAPFQLAMARLGLRPEEILHVAFGWRYDLEPARALGLKTCWINRMEIARPAEVKVDLEVPSLTALAEAAAG